MAVSFGLAIENFTSAEKAPNMVDLGRYATRAQELGFTSLWAWDHLFLGSRQPFPQLEALTTLAVLAAQTREISLGTASWCCRCGTRRCSPRPRPRSRTSRRPARLGVAAGWYEREFDATGTPFKGRGRIFERNLEICQRLWTEDEVTGEWDDLSFRRVRMLPRPQPRPEVLIGGYVDRVLRRVATLGDGWLTYFYTADAFAESWAKITRYAEEAGRDPSTLRNVAQLPLCIDSSYERAQARTGPWLGASSTPPLERRHPGQRDRRHPRAVRRAAGPPHRRRREGDLPDPAATSRSRSSGSRPRSRHSWRRRHARRARR